MSAHLAAYDDRSGRRLDGSYPGFPGQLRLPGLERWLDALEVVAVSAAEWRCPPGWEVRPRVLGTANYSYYAAGRGRLLVDGRWQAIGRGDLVIIPPGVMHGVRQDARHRLYGISGHFHAAAFGVDAISLLGFPRVLRLRTGADDEAIALPARLAREFALREPGFRGACSSMVRDLLMHLIRHHGARFDPAPAAERATEAARLAPALRLIEQRLDDPDLAVGELARTVGLSEVRLRSLFRRATGVGPIRYLQRRRLEVACRMLMQGGEPAERIAAAVGFRHAPFFFRVFRARMGTTPQRYRLSAEGDNDSTRRSPPGRARGH